MISLDSLDDLTRVKRLNESTGVSGEENKSNEKDMTQDMKIDMILHTIAQRLVRNVRTLCPLRANSQSVPCVLRTMSLLLLLTLGTATVWGQTPNPDYSGVYYFVNCGSGKVPPSYPDIDDPKIANITNPDDYFYLVPADNPQQSNKRDAWFSSNYSTTNGDPEKPYLTTYKTKKDAAEIPTGVTNRPHNSVWIVKFASNDSGTDYYHIIHAATGKYIVYDPPYTAKSNRKSMHLLTTDSPGENAKFGITTNSGNYNFRPKSLTTGNRFLNAANANYNYYYSSDATADGVANYFRGLVGLWSAVADGSDWKPEATLLPAPTINYVFETNTFTISYDQLPSGYTILYTIDDSEPTVGGATTLTYADSPVPLTGSNSNTVKAIVARYGIVLTEVATLEPCVTPIITYDYTTSMVSISCATSGSKIYYTINGVDPTASSTEYSIPFSVTSPTTVKAIATHVTLPSSDVAELVISQVATPTIQNNGNNAISIITTTPDATIYYTTDGSTPTPSNGTEYTVPLTENVSNVTIKAIAVKENMITSAVGSGKVKLQCATPVITRDGMTFTLSCSFPTDANLYYKLDGGSEVAYTGTPVSFTSDQLPMTVTAVARHNDYTQSETASMELLNGTGTSDDPFLIYGTTDFTNFVTNVNNGTTASKCYKLETDVSGSDIDAITTAFTGTFDGGMHTISNLGHALFNTVDGGVVKNVILDNVSISGGTNVGAICNEATGMSRIYNCGILATSSTVEKDDDGYDHISSCSSTISGSGYVGGIVGLLDGSSRVINCFSYANVSGGSEVGGIVGHNNVATNADSEDTEHYLKTMVMNCMFYGEVSGTSIAPIYNGEIITNDGDANSVNNFNYFRLESSYIQNTEITKVYNCALGAEDRYLQRFEFFRNLLNSHRELAGWWATGTYSSSEMMKWVLEPSQLGTSTPYPILKVQGKYPSVVNIDAENAPLALERNKGGKLGTLSVTIRGTGGGAVYSAPDGASISTGSLTLNITDKDPDHFNFNYYKVQLPYYNDVGSGNYTGNRVVTGWKIVSITGGTPGEFKKEDTDKGYNFADRNCTNKDLYSESDRIFNQGAYWDVPEGVTAITIEPYWAKCVYLADQNADKVYNTDMSTGYNVPNVGGGQKYTNGNSYSIAGENQVVYTSMGNAIASSGTGSALFQGVNNWANHTVYDYAVVLVGNYHHYYNQNIDKSKPYTVTSIDLDGDNEPDYSYILRYDGRCETHPVRADFINIPGLGMSQKSSGGTGSYNFGIMIPIGWFESTNTSLFRFTQFEYEHKDRSTTDAIIVQGGIIEQWVSNNQKGTSDKIPYIHVGGNVWFKEFHTGCHQDKKIATKHSPISVTGGDYDEFYLTGLYQSDITSKGDNAECYINGGRFGIVCGAAMEGIGNANGGNNTGNITWLIQNADIHEFYAGGLNAAKPVTGNLSTTIVDSHVDIFCGGPKFGDMSANKTVVTNATGCTFGTFFGAGYGGNSYSRYAPSNRNNVINLPGEGKQNNNTVQFNSWNDWLNAEYTQTYISAYGGVSTQFSYQFLPMSDNKTNVARILVDFVKFSLATTHNVTSTLTGCTITNNFYGGGSLGKVSGPVTSTLDGCTVNGNVFGAGYSASLPTVEVDDVSGFEVEPYYYADLGTYSAGVKKSTTTYNWQHGSSISVDNTNHILYTTEDLSSLGTVQGKATLNIAGNTVVEGKVFNEDGTVKEITGGVYGGGDASAALGDTEVNIDGGTSSNILNVFGGGNKAEVAQNVTVNMKKGKVQGDVYGGGALANTNTGNWDVTNNTWASGKYNSSTYATTYTTLVNLTGGTVEGNVYGGGLGRLAKDAVADQAAVPAQGTEGEPGYVPAQPAVAAQPALTAVEAKVYGDILVKLNGTITEVTGEGGSTTNAYNDNCVVQGSIFGCNNLNGSPQSAVTVHIYKTQGWTGHMGTAQADLDNESATHTYHLEAVYGGGNLSAFYPDLEATRNTVQARVIIDGCDLTSISQVYGGGNAASTPATNVTINGAYEIDEVFGGGNGLASVTKNGVTYPNPGANVGYLDYSEYYQEDGVWKVRDKSDADTKEERLASSYVYGSGKANVNIYGGKIHRVFGGSNTKGNVRYTAVTILDNEDNPCLLNIDEAYGGGKSAPMDAEAKLLMSCIPGLKSAYGGAQDADIQGNVTLNITNGTFDRVFGGNNRSGTINGSITVNVEETGCRPLIIGELYGGGNEAPYSVFGYDDNKNPIPSGTAQHDNPVVNVISFTSIGDIYGGGYGEEAVMYGSPTVNISVTYGKWKDYVGDATHYEDEGYEYDATGYKGSTRTLGGHNVIIPKHIKGDIGSIQNVFGGGNAAKVQGNTNVNIGTLSDVYVIIPSFPEGTTLGTGDYTDVYTRNNDGTYTAASGSPIDGTTYYKKLSVVGADIQGNVYGGGNQAEVIGATNVVIGK